MAILRVVYRLLVVDGVFRNNDVERNIPWRFFKEELVLKFVGNAY